MSESEDLTLGEIQKRKLLPHSRDKLRQLCERGKLVGAYREAGGWWRVPFAAINAFKEKHQVRVVRRSQVAR